MAATPSEPAHDPVFKEKDLSAEIRRTWGPQWNAPETSYEFSSGRKFTLRTEDASAYTFAYASGENRLTEYGSLRLTEDGSRRIRE